MNTDAVKFVLNSETWRRTYLTERFVDMVVKVSEILK